MLASFNGGTAETDQIYIPSGASLLKNCSHRRKVIKVSGLVHVMMIWKLLLQYEKLRHELMDADVAVDLRF